FAPDCGHAAMGNLIEGNYIGTDASGANGLGSQHAGLQMVAGNTTIGGTSSSAANVISGNSAVGIYLTGDQQRPANGNLIEGNFIGTDVSGQNPIPNGTGVSIADNASQNQIGGPDPEDANTIAGNTDDGILIGVNYSNAVGNTDSNRIQGNFIGTNA